MKQKAIAILRAWLEKHMDLELPKHLVEFWVLMQSKVYQNWKFLFVDSLQDGLLFEVSFCGDKAEWEVRVFKQIEFFTAPEDDYVKKVE